MIRLLYTGGAALIGAALYLTAKENKKDENVQLHENGEGGSGKAIRGDERLGSGTVGNDGGRDDNVTGEAGAPGKANDENASES